METTTAQQLLELLKERGFSSFDELDSLDLLDFIQSAEQKFSVSIPDSVIVKMNSIEDAARAIDAHKIIDCIKN